MKIYDRVLNCSHCGKRGCYVQDDDVLVGLDGLLPNPFRKPTCPHCDHELRVLPGLIVSSAVRVKKPEAPAPVREFNFALKCPHCEKHAYFMNTRPRLGDLGHMTDFYDKDGVSHDLNHTQGKCPLCEERLVFHTMMVFDLKPAEPAAQPKKPAAAKADDRPRRIREEDDTIFATASHSTHAHKSRRR